MIRRTLQGGLLAVVALFALVPTAAVAAVGDHDTPAPVVGTVPHRPHTMLPALVRHEPALRGAHHSMRCHHRSMRCHHHARHFRHVRHVRHTHFFTRGVYQRHVTGVGRVGTRHVPLNVRSGPGFGYRVVGHRHMQGRLSVVCRTHGSYVHGNRCWYRLAHGNGYVSAHYVRMWRTASWC